MSTTPELSVVASQPATLAEHEDAVVLTPSAMLASIVKGGITADNVATFEKALEIAYKMEARDDEKRFAAAFVRLQAELPAIVAKTVIQNRGKYERFEDVMEVVGPLLTRHGFTVSFSMDFKENRIIETCHLKHGSYTQSNSFAVRSSKADSDTQADCKAATTAKRNALLNALNIVIRQDALADEENDVTLEGDPNAVITPKQAEELEHRCQMTNSRITTFLKLAGAESFSKIPAKNYDLLDRMLGEKERIGK